VEECGKAGGQFLAGRLDEDYLCTPSAGGAEYRDGRGEYGRYGIGERVGWDEDLDILDPLDMHE
jgi:hypothetical protein